MLVVAASYVAELHVRQETARLVAAAMDEAAEQGSTLIHPEPEGGKPRIGLAHEELARRQGYALCTVPLVHGGAVVGAFTLERREGDFSVEEGTRHEHLACMLAPILVLKYENALPLWQRGLAAAKASLRPGTGTVASKPIIYGLTAGFVVLAFIALFPFTYSVSAPARLEGAFQRVLSAPTDGFLSKAYVRPGDRVKAGQLLAELADQDMLVEQRGLQAELSQNENALVAAQAKGDRAEYGISQGKAEAVQSKLELIQQQLERAHVRAPFDGVIIKGDLSQSVGAPLERGAELLTLAPDAGYRVMVEAEESEVAELKPGQSGRLILAAMPALTMPIRLERITALASTENGRHYFAVYAALDGKLPTLRPGMQGVAKIDVDRRSMLVNWVTRSFNWLRFKLWSWGT
jgi:multidrug efflux pump subunit AcrA (membrane-fusion protein)